MKKYHHLLLAIDIYENDAALIEEALSLAKTYGSGLSLVHVSPQIISSVPFAYDFQDAVAKHAQEKMREIQKKFALKDNQIFLRQGRAQQEVIALAKELKTDLIVCGSHGKHGMSLVLGSTANGILHHSGVDVLTIRIDDTGKRLVKFPYKNIVLAIDLNADNKKIRDAAVDLVNIFKATLHIIHVVADVAALGYYPAVEFNFTDEAKKGLSKLITKEALPVKPENVHVEIGFPKQEILDLANRVKAEIIVVGSHGRQAVASAVIGSTANAILHGAKTDVMVVRV